MRKRISILILCALGLLFLTACGKYNPGISVLEFPGVKWNSTPEEVKTALGLTDKQIVADEAGIEDESAYQPEYETWNLFATDFSFLDYKAVGAHFIFIRYPGHEFGLMRVQLYLPEDIDMEAVKANISTIYGEGSDEDSPFFTFDKDGNLVENEPALYYRSDKDGNLIPVKKENATAGFPYYWFSTTKGTEYFSAEAQERYIEDALDGDTLITREAALEYLEKQPLVEISCRTKNTNAALNEKSENPSPYITGNKVIFAANQLIHTLQKYGK